MAKRTPLFAADRPTGGQPTVPQTAVCDLGQHHRCRGSLVSLTAAHGAPCQCPCHGGDDLAVEAALERDHFELPFDLDPEG